MMMRGNETGRFKLVPYTFNITTQCIYNPYSGLNSTEQKCEGPRSIYRQGAQNALMVAIWSQILTFLNKVNKHLLSTSVTSSADYHLCPLEDPVGFFQRLFLTLHCCYNIYLKNWHMVQKLLGLMSKYVHLLNGQCHGLLILDVVVINQLWCSSRITSFQPFNHYTVLTIWRPADSEVIKEHREWRSWETQPLPLYPFIYRSSLFQA